MSSNVKILFCGDTFLKTPTKGADPFSKIKKNIYDYDIIFLNLETVISQHPNNKLIKNICFCEHPDQLQHVASLGSSDTLKIVHLANNHILDYGLSAAEETVKNLDRYNIGHIGLMNKSNITIKIKGITICFLSCYNRHKLFEKNSNYIVDEKKLLKDIKKHRSQVDFILVSAHWGTEHVLFANPTQQKLARLFIDNGADIVIGHHPHCIQGHEIYKDKNIYYSLGNFNFWGFDRPTIKLNQKSIAVSASISIDNGIACQELPININNMYMPEIDHSLETIHKLKNISLFLFPKVLPLLFYRRAAKTHFQGAITSRLKLIKYRPINIIYFFAWLLAKPFNWGCYAALLINLIGKDHSKFNEWE